MAIDSLFYYKAIGVGMTAVLGIVQLVGDFRKGGKITTLGRVNAVGLVLAAAVGIGAELKDAKEKLKDSQETSRQLAAANASLASANQQLTVLSRQSQSLVTQNDEVLMNTTSSLNRESAILSTNGETLHQVDRSLGVIQGLTLAWEMELPLTDPSLTELRLQIQKTLDEVKSSSDGHVPCAGYYRYDQQQHPMTVRFYSLDTCKVIPHSDGSGLGFVLHTTGLLLKFYSRHPANSEAEKLPADMQFQVSESRPRIGGSDAAFEVGQPNYHFEFDLATKMLMICGDDQMPEGWVQDGRIIAIPDLASASVKLQYTHIHFDAPDTDRQVYERLRRALLLRNVTLKIGRQWFRISGDRFSHTEDVDGLPVFEAKLPADLDELRPYGRKGP